MQGINKKGEQGQRGGVTGGEKRRGWAAMETGQDQAPRGADLAGWQRSGRHEQQTGEGREREREKLWLKKGERRERREEKRAKQRTLPRSSSRRS